jgi:Ca-activated chloride channel family protein
VEKYRSELVVPLKPDVYGAQTARHLTITFELRSEHAVRDFQEIAKTYPLHIRERAPNLIKAVFFGSNVDLKEDFAVRYSLEETQADTMRVIAQRETPSEPGFFQAQALLRSSPAPEAAVQPARTVIVLFDNSLSMQWDKLERSFTACESALRRLRPSDRFNLLLFNSQLEWFAPQPRAATTANIEQALAFIRRSRIQGGTDLKGALAAALAQSAAGDPYLVLITDGGATEGAVQNGKLASWYAAEWRRKPAPQRPRTMVFGVGDDANLPLLNMLAGNNGILEWVRSTEPVEFKLNAFLDKFGQDPVRNLSLHLSPAANFDLVYPLEELRFAGSVASWAGRYKKPLAATFTAQGLRERRPVRLSAQATLPAVSNEHPYLPRAWAQARVNALLEKIEREGEDRATVDEMIRLSKKYRFVTPYTSFLAVPRALLRPRVIRPGDPVLRVKTDESIVSVIALFPFGLTKPLRYLKREDTWQTRFLAPADLPDGAHAVRLILRDRAGRVYRESKSFVIASKTPLLRARVDKPRVRAGETVRIFADASAGARTITARLYGAMPAPLRWNADAKASTGDLVVPPHLPPGKYAVHITAEDIAHNAATQEVPIEVW